MLRVERLSEPARELLRARRRRAAARPSRCSRRRAGSSRARCATRSARRSTLTSLVGRRRRRPPLPPRAPARGRGGRPAARRARAAAPRARAGARAAARRAAPAPRSPRRSPTTSAPRATARRRWPPRCAPPAAAERVYAHGEVAALLDRALRLWDRGAGRRGAGRRRPRRPSSPARRRRRRARRSGTPARAARGRLRRARARSRIRARAARILEPTARAAAPPQPRRGTSIATLERALELVEPSDDRGRAARSLLAGLGARPHARRPLPRRAIRIARAALEVAAARHAAARGPRPHHARLLAGDDRRRRRGRSRAARRRSAIAREHDNLADLADAYVQPRRTCCTTLGRSEEARALAAEGREAVGGAAARSRWRGSTSSNAEIAFDAGDVGRWPSRASPRAQRWIGAQTRLGIALRRAALALGRGDHAAAAALLAELEPLAADSSEPQTLGPLGDLVAELRRREGRPRRRPRRRRRRPRPDRALPTTT